MPRRSSCPIFTSPRFRPQHERKARQDRRERLALRSWRPLRSRSRERARDFPQIIGKAFHLQAPRLVVGRAQDGRRVNGCEDEWRERRWDELAAMGRHLELTAEERLRRGRAEAYDRARLDERDLRVEPRTTCGDLARARFLVDAPLAER